MRGYAAGELEPGVCTAVPGDPTACPEHDRLEGSRLAVINAELRLQLLGSADLGAVEALWAPTEVVAFLDVGAAWREGEDVELRWERRSRERVPVLSAGLATRVLVLGILPVEVYAAVPFQRPSEDVELGVRLASGW